MSTYLGLDIGTSATKALLCDHRGRVLATASAEYPVMQPRPGWSEQDPRDWWKATRRTIRAACRGANKRPANISAVGLSGQMHGSVFLGDGPEPLWPALLWNDQRTAAECDEIERAAGGRDELIRMVRNPALTGYTAPKVLWLRNHEPENYRRLRHLLLPKDYIGYRLTGDYAIDVSDASGTLLLDVDRRCWHSELLRRLDIDPQILPRVLESTQSVGRVTHEAAHETGLSRGTYVFAGAGDQPAGAVGMGIVRSGLASVTIGTSGVVFAHSDTPADNAAGTLQSFCHAVPGAWCVFGCMLSAGGSLQWLRNTVYRAPADLAGRPTADARYSRIIAEAAETLPGAEGLYFLPYLTGERCPYPDPEARGAWIGLTARHTRAHLARAVVEGITFGLCDQVELLRQRGLRIDQVRAGGGGARSMWWRQLMADVFDAEVVTVHTTEGAAFGAALLSAVGQGEYETVAKACEAMIRPTTRVLPRPDAVEMYRSLRPRFSRLNAALRRERDLWHLTRLPRQPETGQKVGVARQGGEA